MVSMPLSYGSSLTGLGLCGARNPDRTSGTTGKITATTRKSAIGPNVPSTQPRSVPLGFSIAKRDVDGRDLVATSFPKPYSRVFQNRIWSPGYECRAAIGCGQAT